MTGLPAFVATAAFDAAQGTNDPNQEPETVVQAARDLIYALDNGFVAVDRPNSAYVTALREAVRREEMWGEG
jgi:hypothetical protein